MIRLPTFILVVIALALALCASLVPQAAQAQTSRVVTTCGTVSPSYVAGQTNYTTVDVNGNQCGSSDSNGAQPAPLGVTSTAIAGTVATGGTFQSVSSASATRKGCLIFNPPTAIEVLYVFFGANGSATTTNSIPLSVGQSLNCNQGPIVLQDNVSVSAATTGHAYEGFAQ